MTGILWISALAVALGMDAFSFALAVGLTGIRRLLAWRLIFTVAAFHIFMPWAGFFLGSLAGEIFGMVASVFGALLILVLGGKMIYNVFEGSDNTFNVAYIKSWRLYLLALSVSLDAWSVGFSLGTAECDILQSVLIMGMVAGMMTGAGLVLGNKLGNGLGGNAQMLGGVILVGIGIKMSFGAFY